MLAITDFQEAKKVVIEKINCNTLLKKRLEELGLYEQSEIEIIKNDNSGPLILKIFASKIAISRKEAKNIYAKNKE